MAHPRSMGLLRAICCEVKVAPGPYERIYISRQDATLRRLANEEKLISIAKERGYEIIRMTDYSIEEQIAIVKGARTIAGSHGMALAYIVFNEGPLTLLELFHPTRGTDEYAMIAKSLGFQYSFLIGKDCIDERATYEISPEEFRIS